MTPNLIFSMPDIVVERLGTRFVSAEAITNMIARYTQPEFKAILRVPVKPGVEGSAVNCLEMVFHKGMWRGGSGNSITK